MGELNIKSEVTKKPALAIKKSVLVVSVLMFVSGAIYFYAAYSQMQESSEQDSQIQAMFFAASGTMFIPLGIWMLKNKLYSRAPYVISIIVSAGLVLFYIASRTISLPVVGMQDDVGPLDIASKVIQLAIIAMSVPVMQKIKKFQVHPDDWHNY